MSFDLPDRVSGCAVEGEGCLQQAREVKPLARSLRLQPGSSKRIDLVSAHPWGEFALSFSELYAAAPPRQRQKLIVARTTVADNLILTPRRFHAQFGGVGSAEQGTPVR